MHGPSCASPLAAPATSTYVMRGIRTSRPCLRCFSMLDTLPCHSLYLRQTYAKSSATKRRRKNPVTEVHPELGSEVQTVQRYFFISIPHWSWPGSYESDKIKSIENDVPIGCAKLQFHQVICELHLYQAQFVCECICTDIHDHLNDERCCTSSLTRRLLRMVLLTAQW